MSEIGPLLPLVAVHSTVYCSLVVFSVIITQSLQTEFRVIGEDGDRVISLSRKQTRGDNPNNILKLFTNGIFGF